MLGTMMCLGELATSFPHSGSFQYYAYKFFPRALCFPTPSDGCIGSVGFLRWPQDLLPQGSCRTKCGRTSRSGFIAADTSPYSHWSTCSLRAHLVNLNIGSPASKSLPSFSLSPAVFGSLAIKPQQPNGCDDCGWRGNLFPFGIAPSFSVHGHRGVLISGGGISRQCGQ